MNFKVITYITATIAVIAGLIYVIGLQTLPDYRANQVRMTQEQRELTQTTDSYDASFTINDTSAKIKFLRFAKATAFYIAGVAFFSIILNFALSAEANGMLLPGLTAAAAFGLSQNWYLFPVILFGVYILMNSQRMR